MGVQGRKAAAPPGLAAIDSEHCPLQQEDVAGIQRGRLLAAAARAAAERGAAEFTVASVVQRAGVSRRTFYELFRDSEDCLLAAIASAAGEAETHAAAAYDAARGGWRERVRAGLAALLAFFDERPVLARLLVVEWLAAGPEALERRREIAERIAGVVDRGRDEQASGRSQPPELAGEAVVGSIASVLHARLLARSPGRLVELTSQLMSLVVLPYLGPAVARRELERAVPMVSTEEEKDAAGGSSEQLGIRVTYRTVLALRALAAHPGGSNRQIASVAGIADQGQMSKLLRRLEQVGMACNLTGPQERGAPNAWTLTAKGERVERSLRL